MPSIRIVDINSLDFLRKHPRKLGISRHIKYKTEIGDFLLESVNMDLPFKFPTDKDVVFPPKSEAYTITGHAFELLVRFHICHHHNERYDAEICRKSIMSEVNLRFEERNKQLIKMKKPDLVKICKEKQITSSGTKNELSQRIKFCIGVENCNCFLCENIGIFDDYIETMNTSLDEKDLDNHIVIALRLAHLEYTRLSPYSFPENWFRLDFDGELVQDVEILYRAWLDDYRDDLQRFYFAEFELFKILGEPDFFMENMTLDMKAVKRVKKREHLAQQIGYAFMAKINGIDIKSIGLYYARHRQLVEIPLDIVVLGKTNDVFNKFRGMVVQSVAKTSTLTRMEENYVCENNIVDYEIVNF